MSPPRPAVVLVAALGVLGSACVGQRPPERAPLPQVADLVEVPRPCSVTAGDGIGVQVDQVVSGSGADGVLREGDIVTAVDGVVVESAAQLREQMVGRAAGDVVVLGLIRDGAETTAEVALATNPDDDARPLIGIMITTRYDEIPLSELPAGEAVPGPFTRLMEIDEVAVGLDPLSGEAVRIDVELPEGPWFARDGEVYHLAENTIMGSDGSVLELGVESFGLLGVARDRFLVSVFDDASQEALLAAVDPSTAEQVWTYRPDGGLVPVATATSPSDEEVLVVLRTQGTERLDFAVVDADDGTLVVPVEAFEPVTGGTSFGWYDDRRLLVSSGPAALSLFEPTSGELLPVTIPVQIEAGLRLWTVGDGAHVLVARRGRLLTVRTDDSGEPRTLVVRCDITQVGSIGSGRL